MANAERAGGVRGRAASAAAFAPEEDNECCRAADSDGRGADREERDESEEDKGEEREETDCS